MMRILKENTKEILYKERSWFQGGTLGKEMMPLSVSQKRRAIVYRRMRG